MDNELILEIEHILSLDDDVELQRKSLSKVLVYLLSITLPNGSQNPLIRRFLAKAFEILPSSSLPNQLAKKLEIRIPRKRSITFTTSQYQKLPKQQNLSAEGEEQRRRESGLLSISNIDIHRKFIPVNKIVPGLRNTTTNITITESLLSNSLNSNKLLVGENLGGRRHDREISLPKISINEIIKNPSILKSFLQGKL